MNSPNTLKRMSEEECYEAIEQMTDDECYEAIEQALQDLAREGKIVDTGLRCWSERAGRYEIMWTTPEKLNAVKQSNEPFKI
jgi:hypothetical protein